MARNQIIAGNWKMHKTGDQTREFISAIAPKVAASRVHILIAPPFTAIALAARAAEKTNIVIGAQNMHEENEGAFTGEVSGIMLKEAGADFVILGHSERRNLFQETDERICRKVLRAIKDDLVPILCVGESAEQREKKQTKEVLHQQLYSVFSKLAAEDAEKLIIAYEPIWAIGTGEAATPKIAQETHKIIRSYIQELTSLETANQIPILYGGSVKVDNFAPLIAQEDIDGALIGGTSLDPDSFAAIVNLC